LLGFLSNNFKWKTVNVTNAKKPAIRIHYCHVKELVFLCSFFSGGCMPITF